MVLGLLVEARPRSKFMTVPWKGLADHGCASAEMFPPFLDPNDPTILIGKNPQAIQMYSWSIDPVITSNN